MMKLIVLVANLALAYGSYISGVTIGITPHSHPVLSQYHAQDVLGQYTYGYATPTASKSETKTVDGVTRGGYSYIDSNGHLQSVSYIADPINGFRVAASNLPQDLPDVAYAKAKHLSEYQAIKADHAAYSNPAPVHTQTIAILPEPVKDLPEVVYARAQHQAAYQAVLAGQTHPQVVQDLPEVVKARIEHLAAVEATKIRNAAIALSPSQLYGGVVVPIHYQAAPAVITAPAPIIYAAAGLTSQYHAQDGYGQYTYGYTGPLSSKSESKGADGVTRGGYSYIDANGILQTVHYVADDVHGFRVAATNIPGGFAA